MDVLEGERTNDGHIQIKLGPVEKWVLGLGFLALSYLAYNFVHNQDLQGKAIEEVRSSIMEVKGDVRIVTLQTSDLASLRSDVMTVKLQQTAIERRLQIVEQNQRSLTNR